jgi:hypothetical protein
MSGRLGLSCFCHTHHYDYNLRSTKKIVAISTVSRSDHGVAQTRELACTKVAVPKAIARGMFDLCAY